jgi:hypothetical protein
MLYDLCSMLYMSSICTAAKRCRGKNVFVLFLPSVCGYVFCLLVPWPHLLRPLIGLPLRSKGKEWGVVDGHGVAVCCARMGGALRTCHDAVKSIHAYHIPLLAVP